MHAQETATDTTKFWTKKGNISLLFNQSAYNKQWLGGGTSNVAGNFGLNYDFNYKKDDIVWDNKFILAYGLTKNKRRRQTCKNRRSLGTKFSLGKESQRTMVLFDVFQFQDPNGHWFRQK